MLENQFIRFQRAESFPTDDFGFPIPFTFGIAGSSVYIQNDYNSNEISVSILDEYGHTLVGSTFDVGRGYFARIDLSNIITKAGADMVLKDGQRFFFKYEFTDEELDDVYYSNVLQYVADSDGFAMLKYRCNEDCFGFPFVTYGGYAAMLLPIFLSKPQFKQEDKTYTKTNGEVVVLFAKYFKEWECETEYLPEEMHEKIIAALSCDEIYIDGVRLAKSDSYEVNWDSSMNIECEDNKYKLAKASFKVSATTNSRNSNY